MSEAKNTVEKASGLAKDLFLANLGLAGKAYEQGVDFVKFTESKYKETESKLKDTYSKRNEIFDGLVERGQKVQDDAKAEFESRTSEIKGKFEDTKSQAKAKLESLKSESLEERVKELRETLESSVEKVKAKVSRKADDATEGTESAAA